MSSISKGNVGRGAVYLYIENIGSMISAYAFWLVIARLTTPEIIGISAAMVSFATIIATVLPMGIPMSIERILARALVTQSTNNVRRYLLSSLLLLSGSIIACTLAVVLIKILTPDSIDILSVDSTLVSLTLILISSSAIKQLLYGIIIASINTRILAVSIIYSTAAKFAIACILIALGLGAIGLMIGIVSFTILQVILMSNGINRTLGNALHGVSNIPIKASMHYLLAGGMPNWIPTVINVVGAQLGTIIVFGSEGASQAGFYFMAFSLYTGIQAGMAVLFSISYPVLSAMDEGRERLSSRMIKLSLLTTIPLSYSMIFFSDNIMGIFGPSYEAGSLTLQVLLLSMMPVTIVTGVNNHVYALGKYRETLIIGITTSLPRAILYFPLVIILENLGASLSYTIGSFAGLFLSIFMARQANITISWKETLVICSLPLVISYTFRVFDINFIASILVTLVLTYMIYLKLHIMKYSDIQDALLIMPRTVARPIGKLLDYFARK